MGPEDAHPLSPAGALPFGPESVLPLVPGKARPLGRGRALPLGPRKRVPWALKAPSPCALDMPGPGHAALGSWKALPWGLEKLWQHLPLGPGSISAPRPQVEFGHCKMNQAPASMKQQTVIANMQALDLIRHWLLGLIPPNYLTFLCLP